MKQVLQNLKNGETFIMELPVPSNLDGSVLIQTRYSMLSAGTERMLVTFAKSNWVKKARSQPEKVEMVLNKIKTDGLAATFSAVNSKLDQPLELGYSNVGVVVDPGDSNLRVGQRVVSNGPHAEFVSVKQNLVASIPDNVSDEEASFTVLGAIALNGIRIAQPTIGETFVVFGLGLIGLLTVQLLKANGCKVIGIDNDEKRCSLARSFGAEVVYNKTAKTLVRECRNLNGGAEVDAVIISASSRDHSLISQSAQMCRKRGRVVLVGVVGLNLKRSDFYEKEIQFSVSCSYGPGRYDEDYEKGNDYPVGFVRWTQKRNFEAFLSLCEGNSLALRPLISKRFSFKDVRLAYEDLAQSDALGILLIYKKKSSLKTSVKLAANLLTGVDRDRKIGHAQPIVSFLGAGNYASRMLMPAFTEAGAKFETVVSNGGKSAVYHGTKHRFLRASTDENDAFHDKSNCIVVATRHNLHARQVIRALDHGKSVFVEKPLAITADELIDIQRSYKKSKGILMVGFNRRFSPLAKFVKKDVINRSTPLSLIVTVNAGAVETNSWLNDPKVGGGRIIGEVCHFIDLARFFVGFGITDFNVQKMIKSPKHDSLADTVSIALNFEDGSIAVINYFANGHKSFPKENVQVFSDGVIHQIENFRTLVSFGKKNISNKFGWKQNKGQKECVLEFLNAIKEQKMSPIAAKEIFEVSAITIDISNEINN